MFSFLKRSVADSAIVAVPRRLGKLREQVSL